MIKAMPVFLSVSVLLNCGLSLLLAAAKKAGIKGTGIGLSMVRQIVDACGGEIRLESVAGAGSTFTILLPLAPLADAGRTRA